MPFTGIGCTREWKAWILGYNFAHVYFKMSVKYRKYI